MTSATTKGKNAATMSRAVESVNMGPAAAAFIAGGIGTFFVGLMTTLDEASAGLKTFLTWSTPVGPLSGKTTVGVLAWLIAWFVLNNMWKGKDYDMRRAFTITLVLIGLGLLLTFPPIFEIFAAD